MCGFYQIVLLICWTVLSLLPTVYIFKNNKNLGGTRKLRKKYDAFIRTDINKWNYGFVTLIQFLTFIPRFLLAWALLIWHTTFIMILLCRTQQDDQPLAKWRLEVLQKSTALYSRLHLILSGVFFLKINLRKNISYSEFLGDNFSPTFDGAGIQISNHQSWLDVLILLYASMPSFVAKSEVLNYPIIGRAAQTISCVFLKRGDTKKKRTESLKQIKIRQIQSEKGDKPILHIFPEGCTTNGKKIINFKKGAFHSLQPVKPILIKYKTPSWGLSPAQDILGAGRSCILIPLCGYISATVDILPVFTPNDYFWQKHQREGEEKWETYARTVQSIMAKEGGIGISDLRMEDKVELIKKINA